MGSSFSSSFNSLRLASIGHIGGPFAEKRNGLSYLLAFSRTVPTKVLRLVRWSVSCPETPKSASLTSPLPASKMFAAVKLQDMALGIEIYWKERG